MAINAKEMRKKSSASAASIIEAIEQQIVSAAENGKYKIYYDIEDLAPDADAEKRFDLYAIIENTFRESGFTVLNSEISWEYHG